MAQEKLALMNNLLAGTDNVFIFRFRIHSFHVSQMVASSLAS